jgi:hypothetical protein
VIGAYHRLFEIERSVRMAKSDLQDPAGPSPQVRLDRGASDHRLRGAGGQPLDRAPDRIVNPQIRQDSPALPNHRIQAVLHTITAADPLPDDFRQALDAINRTS